MFNKIIYDIKKSSIESKRISYIQFLSSRKRRIQKQSKNDHVSCDSLSRDSEILRCHEIQRKLRHNDDDLITYCSISVNIYFTEQSEISICEFFKHGENVIEET